MLLIAGRIDIDPQKRDEAIAAAREMMTHSQAEDGCHEYTITTALGEPGQFHIFEIWEDQAALDAHFHTPHMATFQAALKTFVRGTKITKYEAQEASGPLAT